MGMAVKEQSAERTIQSVEPLPPVSSSTQHSRLPRDAAAQMPWPERRPPNWTALEEFARYPTILEGHIVCGLLNNEGVPAAVTGTMPSPDLVSYSIVWVPPELMHRARWLLAWPGPSDAELTYLATGEMNIEERESTTK